MSLLPYSMTNAPRLVKALTVTSICLLANACSDSNDSPRALQNDDPTTVQPGQAPVINTEVVELMPGDFTPPSTGTPTLFDTLSASGTFTRLLALIDKAGLTDTLQSLEPLTFFAPTDDAFTVLDAAIGVGVIDTFTVEEIEDRLRYHAIVNNALDSVALSAIAGKAVEMGNGLAAEINLAVDGSVMINSATVTSADVPTSNGILHVIDTVLTPPIVQGDPNDIIPPVSSEDLATTLLNRSDYSTLLYLVEQAGLTDLLQTDNDGQDWTLFAPSDEAFERASEDVSGLDAAGASQLVELHLFPGRLTSAALQPGELPMKKGTVLVSDSDAGITVGGARIVGRDRVVSNGIIHFVNAPLSPVGL